ncbi:4-hydroxymandelate oxidase [Jiangella alkaliphila]|uniref:4-hydroxymandelate oxidase n=1 Tax=Jiangella alkaliphila TaxID=419479 RepID=A0A1H2L819_9ACTN|nr:alpha-hydroxy acid oxidase [Jiangella alkaliphila]SDU76596.1 4-hydroxymandelate oxidase [Jiangella alkaliphila]
MNGGAVDLTAASTSEALDDIVNVRDFEAAARDRLNRVHYDYFASGAQDEVTVAANEAAFGRRALIPRVLRGPGAPALETTLLGQPASMPVLIAPTAFHRLAWPEAEVATGRAAAAAGVIMIAAMLSTVTVEDIAATGAKLWLQLYVQPDLAFTESLVRRAEAAGCGALVVTVDSPALGRNERGDRNDFHDLPPGMRCANMGGDGHVRDVVLSPEISWRHLDWLRRTTSLPILLKGVLHDADARLAVEHGADGIIVSNHGGRQLDTTPASLDRLPLIADAVAGRVPLLLDGGVRRGTDVAKALALGAQAVAVGRPVLWALAVAGEAGVRRLLELMRGELANAVTLLGAGAPADVTRDQVVP